MIWMTFWYVGWEDQAAQCYTFQPLRYDKKVEN
jgi:hypothetical protein